MVWIINEADDAGFLFFFFFFFWWGGEVLQPERAGEKERKEKKVQF